MKEYITIEEFIENLNAATVGSKHCRILSIGCTSDGKYSFRCMNDEWGSERRFEVSCYEEK